MNDFNGFSTPYQQPWPYQQNVGAPQYQQRQWQLPYYNPAVSQAQYPTQQQGYSAQQQGGMYWVQGEAGAKAFSNLQPGVPVALWDSEESVVYIKTVDNTGKPSMTILDYTERGQDGAKETIAPQEEYVTKEQFDELNKQYGSISDQLQKLSGYVEDIGNRITSYSKPQQNQRRGNNK